MIFFKLKKGQVSLGLTLTSVENGPIVVYCESQQEELDTFLRNVAFDAHDLNSPGDKKLNHFFEACPKSSQARYSVQREIPFSGKAFIPSLIEFLSLLMSLHLDLLREGRVYEIAIMQSKTADFSIKIGHTILPFIAVWIEYYAGYIAHQLDQLDQRVGDRKNLFEKNHAWLTTLYQEYQNQLYQFSLDVNQRMALRQFELFGSYQNNMLVDYEAAFEKTPEGLDCHFNLCLNKFLKNLERLQGTLDTYYAQEKNNVVNKIEGIRSFSNPLGIRESVFDKYNQMAIFLSEIDRNKEFSPFIFRNIIRAGFSIILREQFSGDYAFPESITDQGGSLLFELYYEFAYKCLVKIDHIMKNQPHQAVEKKKEIKILKFKARLWLNRAVSVCEEPSVLSNFIEKVYLLDVNSSIDSDFGSLLSAEFVNMPFFKDCTSVFSESETIWEIIATAHPKILNALNTSKLSTAKLKINEDKLNVEKLKANKDKFESSITRVLPVDPEEVRFYYDKLYTLEQEGERIFTFYRYLKRGLIKDEKFLFFLLSEQSDIKQFLNYNYYVKIFRKGLTLRDFSEIKNIPSYHFIPVGEFVNNVAPLIIKKMRSGQDIFHELSQFIQLCVAHRFHIKRFGYDKYLPEIGRLIRGNVKVYQEDGQGGRYTSLEKILPPALFGLSNVQKESSFGDQPLTMGKVHRKLSFKKNLYKNLRGFSENPTGNFFDYSRKDNQTQTVSMSVDAENPKKNGKGSRRKQNHGKGCLLPLLSLFPLMTFEKAESKSKSEINGMVISFMKPIK